VSTHEPSRRGPVPRRTHWGGRRPAPSPCSCTCSAPHGTCSPHRTTCNVNWRNHAIRKRTGAMHQTTHNVQRAAMPRCTTHRPWRAHRCVCSQAPAAWPRRRRDCSVWRAAARTCALACCSELTAPGCIKSLKSTQRTTTPY
jgi:hypothetical protein